MSILIVEDNEQLSHYLSESLVRAKIPCATAYSMQAAKMVLARDGVFDAILLDLSLPDSLPGMTFEAIPGLQKYGIIILLVGFIDWKERANEMHIPWISKDEIVPRDAFVDRVRAILTEHRKTQEGGVAP